MFIEHRTYSLRPGQSGAYFADYAQAWDLHRAHATCVGHYVVEAGELFRIVALWRYESFEDRLEKRARLNADPRWQQVMGRISPLVTDIRSNLLVPSPVWTAVTDRDAHRKLYTAVDAMDMQGFLAGLTDDIEVRFANHPPARGKEQVRGAIAGFWASIGGLKHRFENVYVDGATQTLEAQIDYTRKDGKVVTVPCTTLIGWRGPLAATMRIYLDLAPVYAP